MPRMSLMAAVLLATAPLFGPEAHADGQNQIEGELIGLWMTKLTMIHCDMPVRQSELAALNDRIDVVSKLSEMSKDQQDETYDKVKDLLDQKDHDGFCAQLESTIRDTLKDIAR